MKLNITVVTRLYFVLMILFSSFAWTADAGKKSSSVVYLEQPKLLVGSAKSELTGKVYQISISDLRPLQKRYGPKEVAVRLGKFHDKSPKDKLKYLNKKIADVVIGPDNQIYLVDGHHLAKMLQDAGQDKLLAKVIKVYGTMSLKEFFKDLRKNNWVYLYDGSHEMDYQELPIKISAMKPDKFRDLAWDLQESGDIKEVDIPFIEFEWARRLFRKKISENEVNYDYPSALQKARELSHGKDAKELFQDKGFLEN